ncbi:MAG: hypothetical protein P8N02_08830, partial [Actinomycetota bacterium]|nr:hypothetical protein [Actinomycetota bacterium]
PTPLVRTPSSVLNTGEPQDQVPSPSANLSTTVAAPRAATSNTTVAAPTPSEDGSTSQAESAAPAPTAQGSGLDDLVEHAARASTTELASALGGTDTDVAEASGALPADDSSSGGSSLVWVTVAALIAALFAGLWRVRRGSWVG